MLQFKLKSHYKIISDETTKTITVKDPDRTQFIMSLKGTEENFREATYQLLDEAMHYADSTSITSSTSIAISTSITSSTSTQERR